MLPVSTSSTSIESLVSSGTLLRLPAISDSRVLLPSSSEDFDNFNEIFENASIYIPEEFKVSEKVVFVDLDMNIRNIKCYDVSVGDISVDHEQKSDTESYIRNQNPFSKATFGTKICSRKLYSEQKTTLESYIRNKKESNIS